MTLRATSLLGLIGLCLFVVVAHAAENDTPAADVLADNRQSMLDTLYDYELTGDPNYDYAQIMIPLNREAIRLSKKVLNKTGDDRLERVAQLTQEEQKDELDALVSWRDRFSEATPGDDAKAIRKAFEGVRERMNEHRQGMMEHDNLNADFATAMIWYHEVAIALSQITLQHSVDAQLRLVASDIQREHTREIAELRNWRTLR